jgi:O-6-methylguanine DNA methyltransferase
MATNNPRHGYERKRSQIKNNNFADRVRAIVLKIPKGKTMSYGEVASIAGNPRAARAVGMIMSKNYDPSIPCHRVVRSDGKESGYNRTMCQKHWTKRSRATGEFTDQKKAGRFKSVRREKPDR